MWSERHLLVFLAAAAAAGAAAEPNGRLRWPAGAAPLGLQLSTGDGLGARCGSTALLCEKAVLPLYTRSAAPGSLTVQLGYGQVTAAPNGAAEGVNLSVVGRPRIAPDLKFYGRVGTVRLGASAPGDSGMNYGVGLTWGLSPSASATLGWDSYDLRTIGGEARDVRATSLGLQWRY
jgi:OmpA-OmpF porin, OOP family